MNTEPLPNPAQRHPRKQGVALIVALLFGVIVVSGIAGLLPMLLNDWKMANRTSVQEAAFSLAECGIEEAAWAIREFGDDETAWLNDGWSKAQGGDYYYREWLLFNGTYQLDDDREGRYRVIVEIPDGSTALIVAEGRVAGGKNVDMGFEVTRYIETEVSLGTAIAPGLIARDTIDFNGQPTFDSYDSRVFPYDYSNLNAGQNVTVGSVNSNASLMSLGNSHIYGDLISGALDPANGGTSMYSGSPSITGNVKWDTTMGFPEIQPPSTSGWRTSF